MILNKRGVPRWRFRCMGGVARVQPGLLFLALTILAAVPRAQAQVPASRKPSASEEKTPSALWREIHHQLLVLPFYSVFDHIAFTLKGPNVTLTGRVLRPTLKEQAEAVVRSLEGVAAVANQIEVLPPSPTDDELRSAIYRTIYENPSLAHYAAQPQPPIHIIVKDGTVSLEGTVDSATDKDLSAACAKGVANVLTVTNNLVLQRRADAAQ